MSKNEVDITSVDREQLERVVMALQAENRALIQQVKSLEAQTVDLGTRLSDIRTMVKLMEPVLGLTNFARHE